MPIKEVLVIEREIVTTTRIYKVAIEEPANDFDAIYYRSPENLLHETSVRDIEHETYKIGEK